MNPARRSKRISDPVEASVVERFFTHKAVVKPTMAQEASGKTPPAAAQQRRRVSKPNVVLPVVAGLTHPGADARGPSVAAAKDQELDLDYHEDSTQVSTQESANQTKTVQSVSRDSDEEDEWAELAMTVKLCLATAAPSEKLLEEHVKLVMESPKYGIQPATSTITKGFLSEAPMGVSSTESPTAYHSPSSSPPRDATAVDRMKVAASLAASRRHDVMLCHAAWPTTHEAPSGEYDFLEISMASSAKGSGSGGWSPTSVLDGSPFKPSNWHSRKPEGSHHSLNNEQRQHEQKQQNQQHSTAQWTALSAQLPAQRCLLLPSQRVVVDVSFRQQFEVARPTPRYAELLSQLPSVFVGGRQRLKPLVTALATAMNLSLQSSGIAIAPWRRSKYLLSKWFPTTDAGTAIPEARTQILPEMAAGDLPTPVPAMPTNLPVATTAELVAAATMKAADALPGFVAMPVAAGVVNDTCQNGEKGLGKAGSTKVPRVVTDSLAEMSQLQLLASKEVLKCCHNHNLAHQKNTNVSSAAVGAVGAAGVVGFAVDDWKPPAVAAKRRPACREGCLSLCMRLQEREEGEVY